MNSIGPMSNSANYVSYDKEVLSQKLSKKTDRINSFQRNTGATFFINAEKRHEAAKAQQEAFKKAASIGGNDQQTRSYYIRQGMAVAERMAELMPSLTHREDSPAKAENLKGNSADLDSNNSIIICLRN